MKAVMDERQTPILPDPEEDPYDKAFQGWAIGRALFANPHMGVIVSTLGGEILECNTRICELLQTTRSTLKRDGWVSRTHPDDIEMDRLYANKCVQNYINSYTMEKRYRDDLGDWVSVVITVVKMNSDVFPEGRFLVIVEPLKPSRMREVTEARIIYAK